MVTNRTTDDAEPADGPRIYLAFVLTKGIDLRARAARMRAAANDRLTKGVGIISFARVRASADIFTADAAEAFVEEHERWLANVFADWLTNARDVGEELHAALHEYQRACDGLGAS